jgi:hypothetical protein
MHPVVRKVHVPETTFLPLKITGYNVNVNDIIRDNDVILAVLHALLREDKLYRG